ncbi:unnamed protein product, partial [Prorocentrum cordatum]
MFFGRPRGELAEDAEIAEAGERPAAWRLFRWDDQDEEACAFHRRRAAGEVVPTEEQDALIARRKELRLAEGIQLFDDWLLSSAKEAASGARVHLVLEAPVGADEVELHVEASVAPAPPAHECLRRIELDSDSDSDEAEDPDDGGRSPRRDSTLRRQAARAGRGRPAREAACFLPSVLALAPLVRLLLGGRCDALGGRAGTEPRSVGTALRRQRRRSSVSIGRAAHGLLT